MLMLQLGDSSFPLGGFAFSYGLESMAHLGRIQDMSQFRRYLENVMVQLSWSEIPFVNSAYACQPDGHEEVEPLFTRYDSSCTIPGIRKGSSSQGRSLLQIMGTLYPDLPFTAIDGWIKARGLEFHYTPLFGLCGRLIGLSHERTVTTYLYIAMRDQVVSAVRLGMLGPQQSQGILKTVLAGCHEIVSQCLDRDYTQACKTAPMLEIAQAHHPHLYSRLFRN